MLVEDLDETGHVRALEVMGQFNKHIEVGNGVLFPATPVFDNNRMTDIFHPDFVNGQVPVVRTPLDIRNRRVDDGFG